LPQRGDSFAGNGYVPRLGDAVHFDWSPVITREMRGPHYGLVVSADLFNQGTGLAVVVPMTSKGGKLSGFELPIRAGRVNGVAVLSGLRSLDTQSRDIRFEAECAPGDVAEANRRIRMVFHMLTCNQHEVVGGI